jgi:hypothetical protein
MQTQQHSILPRPLGEQPVVEAPSAIADTFAGRVHVEWDTTAPVTPFGQLPFFIDYLKQAGLFDAWVADCPLSFTSPNAPRKRDLLGTVLLTNCLAPSPWRSSGRCLAAPGQKAGGSSCGQSMARWRGTSALPA